jgi:hypothetical protein
VTAEAARLSGAVSPTRSDAGPAATAATGPRVGRWKSASAPIQAMIGPHVAHATATSPAAAWKPLQRGHSRAKRRLASRSATTPVPVSEKTMPAPRKASRGLGGGWILLAMTV